MDDNCCGSGDCIICPGRQCYNNQIGNSRLLSGEDEIEDEMLEGGEIGENGEVNNSTESEAGDDTAIEPNDNPQDKVEQYIGHIFKV